MPEVNPAILTWARETAGLSLPEAAKAVGIDPARGRSAEERLADFERGAGAPSERILEEMTRKYRRSLLVFYLEKPPVSGDRGKDFRTAGGAPPHLDARLDALIRDVKTRQALTRSALEEEEAPPLPFVGAGRVSGEFQAAADWIADSIQFQIGEFRAQKTIDKAFHYVRSQIEDLGIFVLLVGNLGSHHTRLAPDLFRGFALSDSIAPFIVVNDQDARAAWAFTAFHELVHIWLGETGVSGTAIGVGVERFCNEVASRMLLPEEELTRSGFPSFQNGGEARAFIEGFSNQCNVSRSMVAFRMREAGLIPEGVWVELNNLYRQDWAKAKIPTDARDTSGGPNYYVVRRHRLGDGLLRVMQRATHEGTISPVKAGIVLGVKPGNVEKLLSAVEGNG